MINMINLKMEIFVVMVIISNLIMIPILILIPMFFQIIDLINLMIIMIVIIFSLKDINYNYLSITRFNFDHEM